MICEHYFISGKVQGVFYRANTFETALALGVTGWVRNLSDGRVEVVACGDGEQLAKLRTWLSKGPSMAVVDCMEVTPLTIVPDINHFEIQH